MTYIYKNYSFLYPQRMTYFRYGECLATADLDTTQPMLIVHGRTSRQVCGCEAAYRVGFLPLSLFCPCYTENEGIVQELHNVYSSGPANPQHTIPAAIVQGHDVSSFIDVHLGHNGDA
jgi:hypothetical protein